MKILNDIKNTAPKIIFKAQNLVVTLRNKSQLNRWLQLYPDGKYTIQNYEKIKLYHEKTIHTVINNSNSYYQCCFLLFQPQGFGNATSSNWSFQHIFTIVGTTIKCTHM